MNARKTIVACPGSVFLWRGNPLAERLISITHPYIISSASLIDCFQPHSCRQPARQMNGNPSVWRRVSEPGRTPKREIDRTNLTMRKPGRVCGLPHSQASSMRPRIRANELELAQIARNVWLTAAGKHRWSLAIVGSCSTMCVEPSGPAKTERTNPTVLGWPVIELGARGQGARTNPFSVIATCHQGQPSQPPRSGPAPGQGRRGRFPIDPRSPRRV